eukprot:1005809-Prymnesium_polylepis.1
MEHARARGVAFEVMTTRRSNDPWGREHTRARHSCAMERATDDDRAINQQQAKPFCPDAVSAHHKQPSDARTERRAGCAPAGCADDGGSVTRERTLCA